MSNRGLLQLSGKPFPSQGGARFLPLSTVTPGFLPLSTVIYPFLPL